MPDWAIGLASIVAAVGGNWWGQRKEARRWAHDRERARWAELVQLTELHEDETRSASARKLAWARLNQLDLEGAIRAAETWHRIGPPKRPRMEDFDLVFGDPLQRRRAQRADRWLRRAESWAGAITIGLLSGAAVLALTKLVE